MERARCSAGQCTRSKAFDTSMPTIQIGTFVLENLSTTKCVVTKCSSTWCRPESDVVLLADGFPVRIPPVPKPSMISCMHKGCTVVSPCSRATFAICVGYHSPPGSPAKRSSNMSGNSSVRCCLYVRDVFFRPFCMAKLYSHSTFSNPHLSGEGC